MVTIVDSGCEKFERGFVRPAEIRFIDTNHLGRLLDTDDDLSTPCVCKRRNEAREKNRFRDRSLELKGVALALRQEV
jgi:hypothetical protein